jgi:anti-sigma regulatory factor (Ser/Thr protein kinase)
MSPTEQPVVQTEPEPFRATLAEGPRSLSPARRALRDWLVAAGADGDWIEEVLVALSEACTNALEHAYAGQDLGSVEVHATIDAGNLEMVVADHGAWKEPLDRGNRGRGRKLMENLMDHAVIESGPAGTVVRMQKELRLGG